MRWLLLLLLACDRPTVRVDRPVRIVSMTVSQSEMLIELVSRDRIAAVHEHAASPRFCAVPGRFAGIKLVPAEIEQILALKPDLVLVASHSPKELVEHLRRAGIPMHVEKYFDDVESILRNADELAAAVGEKAPTDRWRAEIASIPKVGPIRVMSYMQGGWTAGRRTIFDSMLRTIGAVNAADLDGFAAVSDEQVIAWKPDALVVPEGMKVGRWRVVELPEAHLSASSHHVVEAMRELSRKLR